MASAPIASVPIAAAPSANPASESPTPRSNGKARLDTVVAQRLHVAAGDEQVLPAVVVENQLPGGACGGNPQRGLPVAGRVWTI